MSNGIREHPLSFSDLLELERKTLKALVRISDIHLHFQSIKNPAYQKVFNGKKANGKQAKGFTFECYWDSVCEFKSNSKCRIFLQEQITRNGEDDQVGDVTFCLCVGLLEDGKITQVLRKFHFDFTLDRGISRRQRHPIHHAQYGGKLGGILKDHIENKLLEPLIPALSEPRVFHYPMTLAFVISLGFREFPSKHTTAVLESGDWLNVVRKNEEVALLPFLESFANNIRPNNRRRETLFDFLYIGSR